MQKESLSSIIDVLSLAEKIAFKKLRVKLGPTICDKPLIIGKLDDSPENDMLRERFRSDLRENVRDVGRARKRRLEQQEEKTGSITSFKSFSQKERI